MHPPPIVITELGIERLVNLLAEKALASIVVTEFGIVIFAILIV